MTNAGIEDNTSFCEIGMLIIGSRAAKHFGIVDRTPIDWDVIAPIEEVQSFCEFNADNIISSMPYSDKKHVVHMKSGNIYEFEIAWEDTSSWILHTLSATVGITIHDYPDLFIALPETLLFLKKSHRFLKNSPHFEKTRQDIKALEAHIANTIPSCDVPDLSSILTPELMEMREKETYTYKHPSLMQSKKNFFGEDANRYKYDHDETHLAMAHMGVPAYEYFKEDAAEVMCSKDRFFACDKSTQLFAVLEEAYVLAIERSQVPFCGQITPKESFTIALTKICTSITSGWFRSFAYDHYDEVMALYDDDYVSRFWAAVESNLVKETVK